MINYYFYLSLITIIRGIDMRATICSICGKISDPTTTQFDFHYLPTGQPICDECYKKRFSSIRT